MADPDPDSEKKSDPDPLQNTVLIMFVFGATDGYNCKYILVHMKEHFANKLGRQAPAKKFPELTQNRMAPKPCLFYIRYEYTGTV